jgi:hypothetical protein
MQKNIFLLYAVVLMAIVACRKDFEGEVNNQQSPETYTVVDSVVRDSNNLLSTTVTASWWGESKSGFIKGYETSIDNQQTWQYTEKQSGSFLLNLPIGFDRGNLPIFIRAIDNLNQKDPTPAVMVFPVKNSPPVLLFDYSTGRKTVTLPAFRYSWIATDVDGLLDIKEIEIVMNDTNKVPLILPGNTTAASFVANHSGTNFDTTLIVYTNNKTTPYTDPLNGVLYNQKNKIYIRSVDRVGAKSAWAVDSMLIKRPISDFLMVNDYRSSKVVVESFYVNQLNALGAPYNLFDTIESITDQLPSDVFTQVKVMEFYKKIIWYSDDPNSSLGLAQLITESFFSMGGRMFLVCEMPNEFPYNSGFFNFTPVQELVVPPAGTVLRMNTGAEMIPHIAGSGWPTLKSTTILSSARPFYTFAQPSGTFSYDSLCRADLLAQNTSGTTPWQYPTMPCNVMSKRKKLSTGKADMIMMTLPLNKLNGNNNMDSLFRMALINELEF